MILGSENRCWYFTAIWILYFLSGCNHTGSDKPLKHDTAPNINSFSTSDTNHIISTDSFLFHNKEGQVLNFVLQRSTAKLENSLLKISLNNNNFHIVPVFSGDGLFDTVIVVGKNISNGKRVVELDSADYLLSLSNWSGCATYCLHFTNTECRLVIPMNNRGLPTENNYISSNYKIVFDNRSQSLVALNFWRSESPTNTRIYQYNDAALREIKKGKVSHELLLQLDSSRTLNDNIYKQIIKLAH
jgi:hypothetical protein